MINLNGMEHEIGKIVTLVKSKEREFFIYCSVDYLIMSDWSQWEIELNGSDDEIRKQFFALVKEFEVSVDDLSETLKSRTAEHEKCFLTPLIVLDFDKKEFYSNYFDRPIEQSILPGWNGQFCEVNEHISEKLWYWN